MLDVREKTINYDCVLTEKMLTAAVICCSKQENAVEIGYGMFEYMVEKEVPRNRKVYINLLQGLIRYEGG